MFRITAADADEFLIQQSGANFGADLPYANCAASSSNADFTPSWSGNGEEALSSAAFAVYRLTYDPLVTPVTLTLNWNGAPPVDCWIGLSDWDKQVWKWQEMSPTSTVELDEPMRYVDDQQRCYVAVLVLGESPVSLGKIGYGEPPPPPPVSDGYTLFAPLLDRKTYLIDMEGNVVHQWNANFYPGATAKLLPNGHLLRAASLNNANFNGGGTGGRLTEFDWDGNAVWYFDLSTTTQCTHHDFEMLPNGNILLIVWNSLPVDDVILAGRDPSTIQSNTFWADSIIEIEPVLPNGGNIVWEWKAMDHLIQDFNPLFDNYGDPGEHPELIDINYPPQMAGDWTHINCVAYNAEFDQIVLSTPSFNEIWVIDHSTTTAEAAGHTGGRYGRGGDLLYRWGNAAAYRNGTADSQRLFFQHDSHWIPEGLSGAGNVLIFNNRYGESGGYIGSAVFEIVPPQNPDGSYFMDGSSFGPEEPVWMYEGSPPDSFYSSNISSAHRLPNGGTLVNQGAQGRIFELNAAGEIVWEYTNTLSGGLPAIFRAIRYPYNYPGVAALLE